MPFCAKVVLYTEALDQQQSLADELIVDAVLRNLELLSEAANRSRQKSDCDTPQFRGGASPGSVMFLAMPTSAWRTKWVFGLPPGRQTPT